MNSFLNRIHDWGLQEVHEGSRYERNFTVIQSGHGCVSYIHTISVKGIQSKGVYCVKTDTCAKKMKKK